MTLTIGSLFSGIGGLELGLERAGLGPTVWQVERDPYCRAVLAKHWPNATRYEDVKDVGRANLVPVDVICGGFPCQDISYCGKGAGLAGERSGLWYEFARIVRELGPRFVVVENVSALLTRGIGDVLGSLASLGYDAEWSCIPACSVGAPHARNRVFLVAYTSPLRPSQKSTDMGQGRGLSLQPRRTPWGSGIFGLDQPPVVGDRYGVPDLVDRNQALGNSVVPQVAEVVGRVLLTIEHGRS